MKKYFKFLVAALICGTMISTTAFASEQNGGAAPVIGQYQADENLVAEEKAKSELAKNYYEAKISGNYSLAESYLRSNEARTNFSNSIDLSSSTRAVSRTLNMTQYPQETSYYCGYAAIQSILARAGISKTQTQIAQESYSTSSSLPWYISNYSSFSDYPAKVYLKNQTGYNYVPYPMAAAGSTSIAASDTEYRVVFTVDQYRGLLVAGISYATGNSHLPDYPSQSVNHWIAVGGYRSSGSTIEIVDPAANSSAVWWSSYITSHYTVTSSNLSAYASARGIIW